MGGFFMAPRPGFEPGYTAPEAVVLPLDDLGRCPEDTGGRALGQANTLATRARVFNRFIGLRALGLPLLSTLPLRVGLGATANDDQTVLALPGLVLPSAYLHP